MHCLLLAHYFPPDGGPGAQRPISFARHLPAAGVRCTVLSRAIAAQRGYFDPEDDGATATVAHCPIVRPAKPAANMSELLEQLVAAGDAAIRADRPDVILVTMSPFELWRVARILGDRFGIPVVGDLRDPWALDGVQSYRTRWHWRREFAEMRRMLRAADGVVANTPECRRLFLAAEQRLAVDRVVTITNGWDRDDFAPPDPVPARGRSLQLLHVGSFLCRELYDRPGGWRRLVRPFRYRPEAIRPSGRTPLHLLQAIAALRERKDPAGQAVRVVCIGQVEDALRRCAEESGVADAVDLVGYRAHAEAVARMRSADALFLTLHGLPPGERSRIVPGKTYEYLASGRPIVAALPGGDARELVARSPRALLAEPCDAESIAASLVQLHRAWREGRYDESARPPDVDEYERRELAARLAQFLSAIVTRRHTQAPE